jgi:hypothetical protein
MQEKGPDKRHDLTKNAAKKLEQKERFTSQKHLTKNVAKNWRRSNLTEFF